MDQFDNYNNQNNDNQPLQAPAADSTSSVDTSAANPQPTANYTPIPSPQQPQYSYNASVQGQPGGYTYQTTPRVQPTSYSAVPASSNNDEGNNKKGFSVTTFIVCLIVCAVLSTVVSSAVTMFAMDSSNTEGTHQSDNNNNNDGGNRVNANTTITNTTENFVEAVAEKVQPSVVGITVSTNSYNFFGGSSTSDSSGSGVIYTSDGYIITNKHVIDSAISRSGKIKVYLSDDMDNPYSATIVGYDSTIDLAVIKINATSLPAAEIGKSSDLKVGQNVVAVGNPGGLQFMGSVSVGYISGLNRQLTIDSMQMSLIQTDTAINPGNSGGALVDNEGKLIGITNAKLVSEDFEGMGFAIPVDKVTEICDKIITGKDSGQPYIGVSINTNYTADSSQGMPAGAYVSSVMANSPADKAGIKANDIIVAVDGKKITDYNELSSAIKAHKPGDKLKLKIYRDGKNIELTVTVGTSN